MKDRVRLATVCLQISAAFYAILGLACLAFAVVPSIRAEIEKEGMGSGIFLAMFVVSVVLIIGIEVVALGLRRRRFWAWIAGLCVFAIYLPSLFLPLGVLGLWGLLAPGSRAQFGINGTAPRLEAVGDAESP